MIKCIICGFFSQKLPPLIILGYEDMLKMSYYKIKLNSKINLFF
jgi:hypothetical protein